MSANDREGALAGVGFDFDALEVEPVRFCNLCGSTQHVEVARSDRYGLAVHFWICVNCGLGFLSPRPTAREYERFYESFYRPLVSAYHGRPIDRDTIQHEQQAYAEELVSFLAGALVATPSTLLDVGGSTGVVAAAVRDAFGAVPTVLDPAPAELDVAAALGIETVRGLVEETSFGDRRFELVLLCQTIDHLLDIAGALAALRRVLARGGHVFVDVLDLEFAVRRQRSIERAVKLDHPHYLTRQTALAYFARAGLRPIAERLSDDGHWGFVLEADKGREPDWRTLQEGARRTLRELWLLRAEG